MRSVVPLVGLALSFVVPAFGQQNTLKELIVGTWILDSVYDQTEDGIKQEPCTFPQWDDTDGTDNIAMPTENELNITPTKPIQDPTMGAFVPHLNFKRAK